MPLLAMKTSVRSLRSKSARSRPASFARRVSTANPSSARTRVASKSAASGNAVRNAAAKPRSRTFIAHTFSTTPQKPAQGSGSASASSTVPAHVLSWSAKTVVTSDSRVGKRR